MRDPSSPTGCRATASTAGHASERYIGASILVLPSLNRTSHLTLGLIHRGHRTGYEIKQAIDRAARFFWTVSYGQLYPELRRLREAGLSGRYGTAK